MQFKLINANQLSQSNTNNTLIYSSTNWDVPLPFSIQLCHENLQKEHELKIPVNTTSLAYKKFQNPRFIFLKLFSKQFFTIQTYQNYFQNQIQNSNSYQTITQTISKLISKFKRFKQFNIRSSSKYTLHILTIEGYGETFSNSSRAKYHQVRY